MPTLIEVMVVMTDLNGKWETYWGGDPGTPEYFTVIDTLRAYLPEHLTFSSHTENDTYLIVNFDEGCDQTYDYIEIIESIEDNSFSYKGQSYLSFEILNIGDLDFELNNAA